MNPTLDLHIGRRHATSSEPRSDTWRRVRRRAGQTLVGLLVIVVAALTAGAIYVATLPSVADAPARVERILALHHAPFEPAPVPARLGAAVVAVEDEHFYDNFLFNVLSGVGQAAVATVQASSDPGGSTIQQQLAKALYGKGSGLGATLREIGLGIRLSLHFSKPQLLNLYLNAVYFGHGYWGYGAAARGYFRELPQNLSWAQAAMLAGLPQAPSAYDPLRHYALAKRRQRHVLDQLAVNHYLTAAQADAAYRQPLGLR